MGDSTPPFPGESAISYMDQSIWVPGGSPLLGILDLPTWVLPPPGNGPAQVHISWGASSPWQLSLWQQADNTYPFYMCYHLQFIAKQIILEWYSDNMKYCL